ncbi:hypothetical protein AB0L13_22560 [Saccharopolyspora shandongensis]|uniref:hypothetical protein n=1 Tax=Saccharopolyspora shandongensis TaxID=418495 RepID=UPI00342C6334
MLRTQVGAPATGQWWQIMPAVVQTAFWILVGTVTLLTYIHARRTVLQPVRTEAYKLQLEEMTKIYRIFAGKGEVDLANYFGTKEMVNANVAAMYDAYIRTQLGYEHKDKEDRPYAKRYCPSARIRTEALELAGTHQKEKDRNGTEVPSFVWSDYRHHALYLPRGVSVAEEEIESAASNPLVPSELCSLLEELIEIAARNSEYLRDVIEEEAPRMPELYPTIDDITRSGFGWINNKLTRRAEEYKPKVDEITGFCRIYLSSDSLNVAPGRRSARRSRLN